ncbi:MAG TPA: hypothetical protein VLG50_00865 [Candidatus Saccharimonadales bacterium]|nr:hypothetical protein [Candidatus Saccharimonadales bacterium]
MCNSKLYFYSIIFLIFGNYQNIVTDFSDNLHKDFVNEELASFLNDAGNSFFTAVFFGRGLREIYKDKDQIFPKGIVCEQRSNPSILNNWNPGVEVIDYDKREKQAHGLMNLSADDISQQAFLASLRARLDQKIGSSCDSVGCDITWDKIVDLLRTNYDSPYINHEIIKIKMDGSDHDKPMPFSGMMSKTSDRLRRLVREYRSNGYVKY